MKRGEHLSEVDDLYVFLPSVVAHRGETVHSERNIFREILLVTARIRPLSRRDSNQSSFQTKTP